MSPATAPPRTRYFFSGLVAACADRMLDKVNVVYTIGY